MKYIIKPATVNELALCNCTCNGGNCNCKSSSGSYKSENSSTVQ